MKDSFYLHKKTGGIYRLVTEEYERLHDRKEGEKVNMWYGETPEDFYPAYTVTDAYPKDTLVAFYVNVQTGERWARASGMFHDGRFTRFAHPPMSLLKSL